MQLVILNRDGVINEDLDEPVKSPSEWQPLPGSLEAIARLHRAGWHVVVVTNQPGIAHKRLDLDALMRIHEKMHRAVAEAGGLLDAIFFCPHGPDAGCTCRMPRPGLLQDVAGRLHINLRGVPVIGATLGGLQAAQAVDAQPILVKTGRGNATQAHPDLTAVAVYDSLASAVDALLAPAGGG